MGVLIVCGNCRHNMTYSFCGEEDVCRCEVCGFFAHNLYLKNFLQKSYADKIEKIVVQNNYSASIYFKKQDK